MVKYLAISCLLFVVLCAPVRPQAQHVSSPAQNDRKILLQATPGTKDSPVGQRLIDELLAIVATLLSIIAIVYAVKQNRDARATLGVAKTTAELSQTALTVLKETALQLPTRYVGRFPLNIKEIIQLIDLAQSEIAIITDFAGYSSYSDPTAFRDYQHALESALRRNPRLSVRLYVYDSSLHQRILQVSYPRSRYSSDISSAASDTSLAAFIKRMEKRHLTVYDYESFIKALLDDEMRCIQAFEDLERCECWELHETVPVFLWMVDKRECIFTFEYEPERKKNYFSFRTRDGRLIEYFTYYLADVASKANHHPVASIDEVPEMNLLVTDVGHCVLVNGRLTPCKYHRERLEVRHYEQLEGPGERDIDDLRLEVSATAPILELFEQMESKPGVAGDWSLMSCHRRWLITQISDVTTRELAQGQTTPTILQLGTAGPVNYFGNAKVIVEGLVQGGLAPPKQAALYTYDRCLAPIAVIRALLDKLYSSERELPRFSWATVNTYGLHKTFDSSFYEIGADQPVMRGLLDHHVEVGDICSESDCCITKSFFDIAIAHFTFSLWATESAARCEQGYRNISSGLKQGGRLFVALSELHNPAVDSVEAYDKMLKEVGLERVSATRVWDVYDLSSADRQRLLYSREPQLVLKQVILAAYEKV